ncbi:MAG: hypothetical protein ABIH23_19815, partial [bacterium]
MKTSTHSVIALSLSIAANIAVGQDLNKFENESPLTIGFRKQLFVDDFIISRRSGITRELGQVTEANEGRPLLVVDKPWEVFGCFSYGTVLHDENKFRMWYMAGGEYLVAYAESEDGLNWTKPCLGLFDSEEKLGPYSIKPEQRRPIDLAGGENNLVGLFGDGFTCFLDPHETDPAHKYKAAHGNQQYIKACLSHSPDGVHWFPYNNGEPVTARASDTYNQLLWDEDAKTYRLYTRTDFGTINGVELRGNRGMTNPDIKVDPTNWTTIRNWKFDREGPEEGLRRQIYGLTDWIYEGVHFGLMHVFEYADDHSEGDCDLVKRHERDVSNYYIAPSRDGDSWDLSWVYASKPIVPRGPDGSFDKDSIMHTSQI